MRSRSAKSVRNIIIGIIDKLLLIILGFTTKTLFIRLLGAEYNGLNGLYTNILSVLSIAELGVGNVLTFTLYKALLTNDKERIATLTHYFKRIYRYIALGVALVGVALIPFLRFIVKSSVPFYDAILYYILFLLNSVVSYFVVYKTTVIKADQKEYIYNICDCAATFTMYVFQIIYLIFTKNFTGYLIIQVLCTIGKNVVLNYIANKNYPYLKDKSLIRPEIIRDIRVIENIKATFIYKVSAVVVNNTDNILISIILGTVVVGYYSNYSILIMYVTSFITIISNGIIASLGNLNAEDNHLNSYNMFRNLCFAYNCITLFCTACFASIIQEFVPIWIGDQYVLPNSNVIVILLLFYVTTTTSPVWMFRETMGLFKQVRFIMIANAILNIILSILLGIWYGLAGIIGATVLSKLLTVFWFEPLILYKYKFNQKPQEYFLTQLRFFLTDTIIIVILIFVNHQLPSSLPWFFLKVVICCIVCTTSLIVLYRKKPEFIYFKSKLIYKIMNK